MTGYQSKKKAAQAKLDSMEREALKLALEELADRFSEGWHEGIKIDASDIMLLSEAAQALALAQPEQEPVDGTLEDFEKWAKTLWTNRRFR